MKKRKKKRKKKKEDEIPKIVGREREEENGKGDYKKKLLFC